MNRRILLLKMVTVYVILCGFTINKGNKTAFASRATAAESCDTIRKPVADTTAKDFTMMDMDDKPLTLSSFRGKNYVLLDFWASWCMPCRQFTMRLKVIYNKYHDKGLEVISVSGDDSIGAWVTGATNDGMNKWHNIYPAANKNGKEFNRNWGVKVIPTVILIDKNGKIIGRYVGTDYKGNIPELNRKLAEVMP